MLLDQVFDKFENVKVVFVRKNGKLKKVRRSVPETSDVIDTKEKPLFPISKERK